MGKNLIAGRGVQNELSEIIIIQSLSTFSPVLTRHEEIFLVNISLKMNSYFIKTETRQPGELTDKYNRYKLCQLCLITILITLLKSSKAFYCKALQSSP